jgi:hypothetical protein
MQHHSLHQAGGTTYPPSRFSIYKNSVNRTPSPTFLLDIIFIFGLISGSTAAKESPLLGFDSNYYFNPGDPLLKTATVLSTLNLALAVSCLLLSGP